MTSEELYDASVFIISDDGESILSSECPDGTKTHNCLFVMVTSDVLNQEYHEDNTIFICRGWKNQMKPVTWQTTVDEVTPMHKSNDPYKSPFFFSGFRLTSRILMNAEYLIDKIDYIMDEYGSGHHDMKSKLIPAAMNTFDATIKYRGDSFHGFLPAIGQLMAMNYNIWEINRCMKCMETDCFPIKKNPFGRFIYSANPAINLDFWSSQERSATDVWYVNEGQVTCTSKHTSNSDFNEIYSLPIFKICV